MTDLKLVREAREESEAMYDLVWRTVWLELDGEYGAVISGGVATAAAKAAREALHAQLVP